MHPLLHTLRHPLPYCTLYTFAALLTYTAPLALLRPSPPTISLPRPPTHYFNYYLTTPPTIWLLYYLTTTTPAGCRLCSQGAKRVKTHGATYVPREQLSGISTAGSKKPAPTAAAQAAAEQQVKVEGEAASRAKRAKRRGAA